jgi:hypothetical protein
MVRIDNGHRTKGILLFGVPLLWLALTVSSRLNSQEQVTEPLAPVATRLEERRGSLEGRCDLRNYIISKNNGAQHTIKWPKNTGTCTLSVFSLNAAGRLVLGSAQPLAPGEQIESYTSAAGAQWTAFSCSVGRETCKIDIDR